MKHLMLSVLMIGTMIALGGHWACADTDWGPPGAYVDNPTDSQPEEFGPEKSLDELTKCQQMLLLTKWMFQGAWEGMKDLLKQARREFVACFTETSSPSNCADALEKRDYEEEE